MTSATSPNADISAAVAHEHATLCQVADDLRGEEGVSGGTIGDGSCVRSPTDESTPSNSVISAMVSESLSGAREIVCASAAR